MFRRLITNYTKYTVHSRQYAAPMGGTIGKNVNPHEVAESEKKEAAVWGKITDEDTCLKNVERSSDGYDNYWAEKLTSYEVYK